MKKNIGAAWLLLLLGVTPVAQANTTWSAQDYDLYSGDFNGDGVADLLYIAKAPGNLSGIALGGGGGFNPSFQSWPSNYLGINWSGNQYNVVVLQNTGSANRQATILLQGKSAGATSYLLQPNSQGRIVGISQSLGSVGGLAWSADQQHIVAGDFNHDGLMDVFLQATSPTGTDAIVLAAANGQMSNTLAQSWNDGYLGFKWASSEAIIYAGDFNGDGYCDLLIQARPRWVMIDYDVPFPVPTYPYLNGIAFAHSSGSLFSTSAVPGEMLGYDSWSRNAFGVDWSPLVTNILVGQFNGTSYSDILLQALHSSSTSYLVSANGTSSVFSNGTALASNVSWSADTVRLVAGKYSGSSTVGVYFQALTPSGTNSLGTNITGTSVSTTTQDPTAPPIPAGTLPLSAGRTAATFAVAGSGSALYDVPIWAPPAVGPLQLKLSLSYSSRGSDGPLGVGWGISGLSAIARCARTWAQDGGNPQPVTLTTSDRFCLDGQELKLTGGTAGAGGSTYATEIEGFSQITANGASSGAPASFTVMTKSGLIYDYGTTTDSQIMSSASGPVRTWALSQIRDRLNNRIAITYNNDAESGSGYTDGSYRVKEIDYPYTANGQGPFYSMTFTYGTRPTQANVPMGYLTGSLVREPNELQSISVQDYQSTTPTRTYQLGYAVS